jgi:hypothetical protein
VSLVTTNPSPTLTHTSRHSSTTAIINLLKTPNTNHKTQNTKHNHDSITTSTIIIIAITNHLGNVLVGDVLKLHHGKQQAEDYAGTGFELEKIKINKNIKS